MKPLLATAAIALMALAGTASAQTMRPATTSIGAAPWMMDDGSSSDHPIHNRGDFSAARLNAQYQGGLTVPPGQGFPALPGQP